MIDDEVGRAITAARVFLCFEFTGECYHFMIAGVGSEPRRFVARLPGRDEPSSDHGLRSESVAVDRPEVWLADRQRGSQLVDADGCRIGVPRFGPVGRVLSAVHVSLLAADLEANRRLRPVADRHRSDGGRVPGWVLRRRAVRESRSLGDPVLRRVTWLRNVEVAFVEKPQFPKLNVQCSSKSQ